MNQVSEQYVDAVMNAAATRTFRIAARFGMADAEREDFKQELILDMLEHAGQFDPQKGSAGTFTGMVSKNRATELLDRKIKDRMRLHFGHQTHAANDSEFQESDDIGGDNVLPLWGDDRDLFADSMTLRDLEKAMAYMSDEQLALFELLGAHQDLPSACAACGTSSATFYRRVTELQMHLRMFGIRSAA